VTYNPLLSAAVFHSDKAEWWLRQERDNPTQSGKFKDNCRKWYALHRMWMQAIERAQQRGVRVQPTDGRRGEYESKKQQQ